VHLQKFLKKNQQAAAEDGVVRGFICLWACPGTFISGKSLYRARSGSCTSWSAIDRPEPCGFTDAADSQAQGLASKSFEWRTGGAAFVEQSPTQCQHRGAGVDLDPA
jgi:hypothetical protein